MKKVIAILVVAVVLIGAVFADSEAHTLNVSVTLSPILPQFALQYDSVNSNTTPSNFANNGSYTISSKADAAGSDVMADNSITVTAVVLNAVRQRQTYTLTFPGGAFTATDNNALKVNGQNTNLVPTISAASSITTAVKGINVVTASGASLEVPFAGPKMATTGATLGTATFSYGNFEWDTVDPGTYTTNIVLTITT